MPSASPLAQSRTAAPRRVLAADDDGAVVRWLRRALEPEGFVVEEACDAGALVAGLARDPDVVLLDLRLGDAQGVELIPEIRRRSPDTEIVVMTGYASVDSAVACMRAGAFDYLEKPFPDRLRVAQTLRCALERKSLRARNRELESELEERSALARIVGQSPPMRRVLQLVRDLARSESSVLIQAESGTGKELLARALHETSPRRAGPFVPVDCGALPEGIFESELFGHARGAFTGATRDAPGLFRAANGGTLFLDEIGELPLALQAKLLRALQEREVRPLGASGAVPVDVRVVSATNRDLDACVRSGHFRTDLFYRLRVVEVALPPLRERREDIPLLVAHFLEHSGSAGSARGIEPDALAELMQRAWPGNVRELLNALEASVALARGQRITIADLRLPSLDTGSGAAQAAAPPGLALSLEAWERACIEATLASVGGDVRRAAELLGVGRSTLYRKLRGSGSPPDTR